MQQRLARPAPDVQINQDVFVDAVPVIQIMWVPLEEPARLSRVEVARKDSAGPFVVPRSLVRIPGAWIGRAVKDQVLLRVIRDKAPHRAAPDLPMVRRP